MVERVILRCLQAKPALRPGSALAVAAALPGGDPLAEALAAGETPSPEMVAAAGEGEGLQPIVAISLLLAVLVSIAVFAALSLRFSALERLRPEYPPEVLAQKAKDTIQHLGFTVPAANDAYGFEWDSGLLDDVSRNNKSLDWDRARAKAAAAPVLVSLQPRAAHGPGIPRRPAHSGHRAPDDPPAIDPGMLEVVLDSFGRLTYFKRMPSQRLQPAQTTRAVVDRRNPSDARVAWIASGPRPFGRRTPARARRVFLNNPAMDPAHRARER
jgi:serine/threonine-protein kinase